ncbi:hypothetical protein NKH72_12165 [Mesorhizobium sp. M0955]
MNVMVSCREEGPFEADVVRLLHNDPRVGSPDFREEHLPHEANGTYQGRPQPVHKGSFGIVAAGGLQAGSGLTMLATIWPTQPGQGPQCIVHCSGQDGTVSARLEISDKGRLEIVLQGAGGDRRLSARSRLATRCWYRVWATLDAATGDLALGFRSLRPTIGFEAAETVRSDGAGWQAFAPDCIAFAAEIERAGEAAARHHFNGKIERPILFDHSLSHTQVEVVFADGGARPRPGLIGAWDFSRDIPTDRIVDIGPHHLYGRLVNAPTRAMTGSNWTAAVQNWPSEPELYDAIHFHDDDLADCQWEPSLAIAIPEDWRSGVYAVRLRQRGAEYHVPFIVRPQPGRPRADLVVLLPTATYQVYGNHSAAPVYGYPGMKRVPAPSFEEAENGPVEESAYGRSGYYPHSDGSGISICSRLRPVVEFRPKFARMTDTKGLGVDKFALDLYLLSWLESRGISFDIVTDEDLDREGLRLIKPYRVLMTGSHPEYVTEHIFDAVEQFVEEGGRLMYMGGDGFDARVAYHPHLPGLLEIRRGVARDGSWEAEPGEECSAFDGRPMGLWRHLGRPSRRLLGVGMSAQCELFAGVPYRRAPDSYTPRAQFIFEGVEESILGDFGVAAGAAAGHELDRSDASVGTPAHALVLAVASDLGPEWMPLLDDLGSSKDFTREAKVRGEIVFFETPAGGAIFSVGSTTYVGSLVHNSGRNVISRITGNVLRRFLDPTPFSIDISA